MPALELVDSRLMRSYLCGVSASTIFCHAIPALLLLGSYPVAVGNFFCVSKECKLLCCVELICGLIFIKCKWHPLAVFFFSKKT